MKIIEYAIEDYLCDDCGDELRTKEGFPYIKNGNDYFCFDCALKRGLISPMDWLNNAGGGCFEKATFDGEKITAYKKWGRGYMKSEIILEGK